jgi:DNA end-binding protein Ku
VRPAAFDFLGEDIPQVRSRELTMAGSLIDSLTEPVFEPDKYQDGYRAALEALIEEKVAGNGGAKKTAKSKAKPTEEAPDLVDVLQASVEAAKRNRPPSAKRKSTGT